MCQNTTMRVYGAWIKIYYVICNATDSIFLKSWKVGHTKPTTSFQHNKPVSADECWKRARQNFNTWNKKYNRNLSQTNKECMIQARKQYKNISWRCCNTYDKGMTAKLLEARVRNAKSYWNYWMVIKGPTVVILVLKYLNGFFLKISAIKMEILLNQAEILVNMLPKIYVMNWKIFHLVVTKTTQQLLSWKLEKWGAKIFS